MRLPKVRQPSRAVALDEAGDEARVEAVPGADGVHHPGVEERRSRDDPVPGLDRRAPIPLLDRHDAGERAGARPGRRGHRRFPVRWRISVSLGRKTSTSGRIAGRSRSQASAGSHWGSNEVVIPASLARRKRAAVRAPEPGLEEDRGEVEVPGRGQVLRGDVLQGEVLHGPRVRDHGPVLAPVEHEGGAGGVLRGDEEQARVHAAGPEALHHEVAEEVARPPCPGRPRSGPRQRRLVAKMAEELPRARVMSRARISLPTSGMLARRSRMRSTFSSPTTSTSNRRSIGALRFRGEDGW